MSKPAAKPSTPLPSVTNKKDKPTAPAASSSSSSSSDVAPNFMEMLAKAIPSDEMSGNFYYEGGRAFADRALNKPQVHEKLIGYARDAIKGTGMFDPASDVMKSAADIRASQLPARPCDWEKSFDNGFMLFSFIPALLSAKGFMDNGVAARTERELAKMRAEAEAIGKERDQLSAELNNAKRRSEELEQELEEARKAPKDDPLSGEADI